VRRSTTWRIGCGAATRSSRSRGGSSVDRGMVPHSRPSRQRRATAPGWPGGTSAYPGILARTGGRGRERWLASLDTAITVVLQRVSASRVRVLTGSRWCVVLPRRLHTRTRSGIRCYSTRRRPQRGAHTYVPFCAPRGVDSVNIRSARYAFKP
jgi:hypothetical protein